MVLNNLIEIHLTPPFASDFKSNLFNRVKFSYNQVYLTHIQIVSLEILPNYNCIKGPTIESIVVPLFYSKALYNGFNLYNQNGPTILCIV